MLSTIRCTQWRREDREQELGSSGKGASSWFLMCDPCRDRYLASCRSVNNINSAARQLESNAAEGEMMPTDRLC